MKLIILAAALFFVTTSAVATPIQWSVSDGGNGHYYDYMAADGIFWADARDAAAAGTYLGLSGHLATITSQAENAWVWAALNPSRAWLGGYQDPDAPAPDANWHWITGEAWQYTNWHSGEPNDFGTGNEWALHFDQFSFWNDVDGIDWTVPGYVVEYEVSPLPTQPSTWGKVKALYR